MKKILFAVLMFLSIPVFAGIPSYFPYGLKASTITVAGQSTLSSTTINGTLGVRGLTYTWPSAHAIGDLTNDGAGNLSWASASVPLTTATVAATPMVWTDTQTFQQNKVFVGNYIADIPVIVASGTMHEVASKTFDVPFQDNRRYELVFISTCTTSDIWGIRFNGDTSSVYANAFHYFNSTGHGGGIDTTNYGRMQDNFQATTELYTYKASLQVRKNDPIASVIWDWQAGVGAVGQGAVTDYGHGAWSVANTLPTTMTLVHMSGTCSGAYLITTTAWDASF